MLNVEKEIVIKVYFKTFSIYFRRKRKKIEMVIILGYFLIQNSFFFLCRYYQKKCTQSEVSPNKISPNWPITRGETTVARKLKCYIAHKGNRWKKLDVRIFFRKSFLGISFCLKARVLIMDPHKIKAKLLKILSLFLCIKWYQFYFSSIYLELEIENHYIPGHYAKIIFIWSKRFNLNCRISRL